MQGYLEKGIQTPRSQGRSTKIISMIKWIRTSRLSIKNSLSGVGKQPDSDIFFPFLSSSFGFSFFFTFAPAFVPGRPLEPVPLRNSAARV